MRINNSLIVRVQPIEPDGKRYRFFVENVSARTVRNILFNFYEILGPGDFGVDDTYMPRSMTIEKKFEIESLAPGENTYIDLDKWGPLSRYRGNKDRTVLGQFADGSEINGHTLPHEVALSIESDYAIV